MTFNSAQNQQDDGHTRTAMILKLVSKARAQKDEENLAQLGTPSHSDEHAGEQDHEDHVDERWLVSYADMMTLLFGLFVMLFSMANKFDKVQQALSEQFSSTKKEEAVSVDELKKEIEKLKKENLELQTFKAKAIQLETELNAARLELKRLTEENERLRKLAKDPAEFQRLLEKAKKADALQIEVTRLKKELEELVKLREDVKTLTTRNDQLVRENTELKRLLAANHNSFMAVVIRWPTKDHDIDLIVQDPEGTVFNFKNKKFAGKPGNLALDTRRGPGTELWQTDQLIPGTYKVTYLFYSQYGNPEPTQVSGTVFSSRGSVELPAVTLTHGKQGKIELRFSVDKAGKISRIDN